MHWDLSDSPKRLTVTVYDDIHLLNGNSSEQNVMMLRKKENRPSFEKLGNVETNGLLCCNQMWTCEQKLQLHKSLRGVCHIAILFLSYFCTSNIGSSQALIIVLSLSFS